MNAPAPIYYPASPIDVRDGTLDRAKAATGFENARTQRALPTKDDQLPYVIVWHGGDRTEPMGDANVGVPSFDHTLKLFVVVAVTAPDSDEIDSDLVEVTEYVRAALLTDPTWLELFEACTSADISYALPAQGDVPYGRGTIEFTLTYRSEWPPVGGEDLREVAVTAGVGPDTYFHQSFHPGSRP